MSRVRIQESIFSKTPSVLWSTPAILKHFAKVGIAIILRWKKYQVWVLGLKGNLQSCLTYKYRISKDVTSQWMPRVKAQLSTKLECGCAWAQVGQLSMETYMVPSASEHSPRKRTVPTYTETKRHCPCLGEPGTNGRTRSRMLQIRNGLCRIRQLVIRCLRWGSELLKCKGEPEGHLSILKGGQVLKWSRRPETWNWLHH